MNKEKTVAAIVVTYNRKELLKDCLDGLFNQVKVPDRIFIIDNASTDGTGDFIKKTQFIDSGMVEYVVLKRNTGSAGGFYEGVKRAYSQGFDWLWLMDDDVIPQEGALAELLKANEFLTGRGEDVGFLCSRVVGEKGEEMNLPNISKKQGKNGACQWGRYLYEGIVEVSASTYVSVLVSKKAVKKIGFPTRELFIWGDDIEYTVRISNEYPGYFIGKSKVIHRREIDVLSIAIENDLDRVKNFYYLYRNNGYITRKYYNKKMFINFLYNSLMQLKEVLFSNSSHKLLKIEIVIRGLISSMFFKI